MAVRQVLAAGVSGGGALNLPCRLSSIVNRPSGYSRRQEFPATDEARPMSKPIALSDTQMDTIVRLAGPLLPPDRDVYLREVAAALDGREEIGDGFVARVCAEVQRRLWHPPLNEQPPRRQA
jgi:hypothetical protein